MPNRLADSSSPYLQQHADDPVDWWPWGPDAFAAARARNVPVMVSVGYAACHWCHVMAHESFADEQVAAFLNEHFVAIKVDRQERPDLDAVYLKATQALTGQGGWPMTVFCTPDARPFFAGTYFPPTRQGSQPAFLEVLAALAGVWRSRGAEVLESAAGIVAHLAGEFEPPADPGRIDLLGLLEKLGADFDPIHGGFGTAPKFPAPLVIDALLVKGDPGSLDIAQRSLAAMARGALHDQLGGGFHRYCVDAGWVVPHFEKMLYDNALLLGAYVRGWRRTPDHDPALRGLFERAIRGLIGWLERELLLPGGGFAASLDADSADVRGVPVEGIYYVWSPELLADALGPEDGRWAADTFHVTALGTCDHGYSTLQLRGNPDPARLAAVTSRLLEVRQGRWAPARDDNCVAAWNGWLIDSLVWAAEVFGESRWLELAAGVAEYLWRVHWVGDRLVRVSRDGVAGASAGLAEDYGALALGFARLGGALGQAVWVERAVALLEAALAVFSAEDGGFYDTAADAEELFARPRDVTDNPTPSGTVALVTALRLVSLLADRPDFTARADAAMVSVRGAVAASPRFAGWGLSDLLIADEARKGLAPAVAVVLSAEEDPLGELARATWRMAPAGTAIITGVAGTAGFAHHFAGRTPLDGASAVYVCRGTTCFAPATQLDELRTALWSRC